MSRMLAGVGAVSGIGVGGLVGAMIGGNVTTQQYTPIEAARVGAMLGSVVGAFAGASLGAGSDKPKQIAVVTPQVNEGMFP